MFCSPSSPPSRSLSRRQRPEELEPALEQVLALLPAVVEAEVAVAVEVLRP